MTVLVFGNRVFSCRDSKLINSREVLQSSKDKVFLNPEYEYMSIQYQVDSLYTVVCAERSNCEVDYCRSFVFTYGPS